MGKICLNCKVEFKGSNIKYCSLQCLKDYIRKQRLKICDVCGEEFYSRYKTAKHCSRKCRTFAQWKLVSSICEQCGKGFEHKQCRDNARFCCNECKDLFQTGNGNPSYIHGQSRLPYSIEFNDRLRGKIRQRDRYTCQLCNEVWGENTRQYSIHHIDYNKKNNENDNLITLCHLCHMATNTNREHWEKYFKDLIKKIWQEKPHIKLNAV